ncbi:MAG: hypothetical protein KJZ84_11710 [Bryobacteraceae bacterium]|nr:hypothetical protein [Bryobacteraceae bacterium]
MRSFIQIAGLLAALGWAAPVHAVTQCQLSGTPLQMRVNGLAEPAGEIVLRCVGGAPFSPVKGSLQVALNSIISNRLDQGFLNEVSLSLDFTGTWQPVPGVRVRALSANVVLIENIDVAFGADGQLGMRVAGLRTESGSEVIALLSYTGTPQLPVPFATVVVGRATGLGLGSSSTATIPRASPALPQDIDFEGLLAARAPFLSTRVTEAGPAVLRPKGSQHEIGTRVIVRFGRVPEPGRVYVPEAVAGLNALQPTSGGNLGLAASAGQYNAGSPPTLLLARVRRADANGAGGAVEFNVLPGLNVLGQVAPADVVEGHHYVVYEVLDANEGQLESAQFPAWVVMPPEWREGGPVIRSQASIGPVSNVRGPSETAPVPRFAPNEAIPDCPLLNDCAAPYFPRLRVTPISPTEFTAPSGSGHQIGNVIVENTGGDLLEWRVTTRFPGVGGWIRVFPEIGVGRATIRYDVLPGQLTPGEYAAQLVITAAANAGEAIIPIQLTVTMPLPPAEPSPVVRDVVNAGNRLPGPVAPGSLAYVLGENFGDSSAVTVAGIPARIIFVNVGEIMIEVPPALDPAIGRAPVRVDRGGKISAPWGVEIAPVAPAVVLAMNEDDGKLNSAEDPVRTGSALALLVTGLRLAVEPVFVRIHDRDIEEFLRMDGVEEPAGVRLLRFIVPEDLPAMSTAVLVCGRAEPDGELICAQPHDVYLRKP